MRFAPFRLERYFARYEFSARYLLSSSDCDGLALQEVLALADAETADLWAHLRLGYTESAGLPLLRREVAALYRGIAPEQVLIVAPEEGVFIAMNCLLQPGDHVICTFPGYQSLYAIAKGLGCSVSYWQPVEAEGWRFDPQALAALMRPTTRLVVCNFPHNPTGALPDAETFRQVLDVVRAHNLMLFSDEMYRFLELDPATRLPSAVEEDERAVALFGMSKTFGLAGARIGWLVTRDEALYQQMAAFKDYTTICSSAPSELLALIVLRARETILQRHLARIARNLALLDGFFAAHSERLRWVRPRAGTVAFPRLYGEPGAAALCEAAVHEAGVLLLPASVYDYGDRHIRLGFGRENLPEALAAFDAFLRRERS